MPDPIASQFQMLTQQVQSKGLAQLLQNGPLSGRVLSQLANGKTNINFQGQNFTIDIKGKMDPGQQIIARLVDGKIQLDIIPQKGDTNQTQGQARSITTLLANMGISSSNAQPIAQALIQAGIPLDQTVLNELIKILPQADANQAAALAFIFSRGIPINPSIASLISNLFAPKPKLSVSNEKIFSQFKSLEEEMDEEDDPVLSSDQRKKFRELRKDFEQQLSRFHHAAQNTDQEDIEEQIRLALTSPEALIESSTSVNPKSYNEAIVRLLLFLLEIHPTLQISKHSESIQSLIHELTHVHESLSAQILQNQPPQGEHSNSPVYVQIPYMLEEQHFNIELLYQPNKHRPQESGSFDLTLELSNLGPMHINLLWDKPNLSISMTVTDPDIQDYLQGLTDQLSEGLTKQGFHIKNIGIKVGEIPKTLNPNIEQSSPTNLSGLDIRA
jgi:hypothetical protein